MAARWVFGLLVLALAGCATRPVADEKTYNYVGAVAVLGVKCGKQGMVDAATAAFADARVRSVLGMHQYDPTLYNKAVEKFWNYPEPSQQDCGGFAIEMAKVKQQIQVNNAAIASVPFPDYTVKSPTNTWCNRIGTQTFCQTY